MTVKERKAKVVEALIETYGVEREDAEKAVKLNWSMVTADVREENGSEYREACQDGMTDEFWTEVLDDIVDRMASGYMS